MAMLSGIAGLRRGVFSSYSGAEITPVIDMPGRIDNPVVIGEIHTISYSTHSEIVPVRLLSSRRVAGFSRGPRTVAGTLIFTVFERDIVRKLAPEYMSGILIDEMPPFNINVVCKNDSGVMSRYAILGVRLADGGMVMSVDNIITENTISYIAEDMVSLHVIGDGGAYGGGVESVDAGDDRAVAEGEHAQPESFVIAAEGVTVVSADTFESTAALPDDSFHLEIDVSRQFFRQQDDGEVVAVSVPVVGHSVGVYEGSHPEWDGASTLHGVEQAKQLLVTSTDSEGSVRVSITRQGEGDMQATVVALCGDYWRAQDAVLQAGELLRASIKMPTAASAGGSAEQSWEGGLVPSERHMGGNEPPKYVWVYDEENKKDVLAAVADNIPGLVSPRWWFDYAVDITARCYYLAQDADNQLVRVPVNGPQLQAKLHLAISYDDRTGHRVYYPFPIAADGSVSARSLVVGYLRHVSLEYVPVDHVHTLSDYLVPGYCFGAFHVNQYPTPRPMFGTRDKPGVLDLGDIVFENVRPRSDAYNVHLCGVAKDASGVCPEGARVAVQMRWGDGPNDKCYISGGIGVDGYWYVSTKLPVSVGKVWRLYVEYKAPAGYSARGPFQVDRKDVMIPPNTSEDKPYNVLGLLSSVCKDDPHIVFSPAWHPAYPDGVPESEECSVPATMRIGGRVLRSDGSASYPIANAMVFVTFMAMETGSKAVTRPFTRHAVTDASTGRFQLMIPPNKQLLRIAVYASGFEPFNEEWPYLDGDPKKYTRDQAAIAEDRRRRVSMLKNEKYDIYLSNT